MFTHSFRDDILGTMRGSALAAWTPYVGLLTGITDFRAGTVTEASYTGYGTRPSVSFGAQTNTSPTAGRQVANDAAATFPQNTGTSQDVIAFGLFTASTGGTCRGIGFLDTDPPILATGATSDALTAPAHGLSTDQRVFVMACPGAVIPTGLSENVAYYVLASGLTTDTLYLSTSSGGAAVNITGSGACLLMPYTVHTIAAGETPQYGIGTLVVRG